MYNAQGQRETERASCRRTLCSCLRKSKGNLVLLLTGVLHQLTLCALKAHRKHPDRWKHLEWHILVWKVVYDITQTKKRAYFSYKSLKIYHYLTCRLGRSDQAENMLKLLRLLLVHQSASPVTTLPWGIWNIKCTGKKGLSEKTENINTTKATLLSGNWTDLIPTCRITQWFL